MDVEVNLYKGDDTDCRSETGILSKYMDETESDYVYITRLCFTTVSEKANEILNHNYLIK